MLEDLRDREMILQREESGFAGTVEYVFRHAILRDVTYETVIPRQRRALHKLVGDWLLEIGGERAGEHTLLVAEHYSRAEEAALAASHLANAAERTLRMAAYEETAALLERARGLLADGEHTGQWHRLEVLRAELEAFRGMNPKAEAILNGILTEVRASGNVALHAEILGKLGRLAMWQGDAAEAMQYIGEALELSRKAGDKAALMFNLRQMGNMTSLTNPADAIPYHEESVRLARELGDLFGESTGLNSIGIAYHLEGRVEESEKAFARSLEIARARGDRTTQSMVLGNLAGLHLFLESAEAAQRAGLESLKIAQEIGAMGLLGSAQTTLIEIYLRSGNIPEARAMARGAADTMRSVDAKHPSLPLFFGLLKLHEGDRKKGLEWIGFTRAHDPNKKEVAAIIHSFREIIRGGESESEVEAAMRAGENLSLDEILAEVLRDG